MEIKEITDKNVWENFFWKQKEKSFLNSWNWGEFQKKQEEKIWRLGIYEDEKLLGAVLVIKVRAKRGTFLFVPHIMQTTSEALAFFIEELKKIAKKEKIDFIRIAPIWERSEENIKTFKDLGFLEAPIHTHPENTWELDISKPEEQLLREMRKTTRYLIRKAEKNNDIEIIKSNDLEQFSNLLNKTARRHNFTPFSLEYLKDQFSSFLPDSQIAIFLGKYNKEVVAGAIIIFWQNIAFYHHGASLKKYNSNKVPVSYLIQWQVIKEAKGRGCSKYNFWGIAEPMKKSHPWYGPSKFKMGFGGEKKEYVKTQDLPLLKRYYLTRYFEKLRKLKRRL